MKKIIMAFWATGLCFAPTFAQAQAANKVSGEVRNNDGKGAEAATVALMKENDSVLLRTALTDAEGRFVFESLAAGMYQLQVTAVGYQPYSRSFRLAGESLVLEPLSLVKEEKMMGAVVVTAKKPLIERKIDRTVVNVDALISNSGTTALDVLEKSPGILVDQNGVISLRGKQGVVVFIDDRPTYLSAADLQNYLRSLPSSALEQIEIMTNPPARYDAAGTAGVINIRTKKNKLRGFNGNLNLAYNQGVYGRTNNSLNLNYRRNKFNFFANLSYNRQNVFNDLDINRYYLNEDGSPKSYFLQNTFIRRKGNAYTGKLGMDFYQDARSTWGIVLTGQSNHNNTNNRNVSNLLNAAGEIDSVIKALNTETGKFENAGINLNYRRQLDKSGHELTFDLDYIHYKTDNDQLFDNTSYDKNGAVKIQDFLSGSLPTGIHIYSAKTDYTKPLKGGYVFSTGLKASYTRTDNLADYFYTVNNTTTPDYDKSNHFIYKENINAAYLNLNKDFAKLSVQLGLRFENTVSRGNQLGNAVKPDSSFTRNYNSLFPTVYFLYKLDSSANHQIGLNYGRRINRPAYRDLNPFVSPLDKFTFYVGNPFLKPAFTDNIELSYTFRQRITATLTYMKTHDETGETIEIEDGTYFSRPGNLSNVELKSISVDGSQPLAKWLTLTLYTELTNIHSRSSFYTGLLDNKGTFWFVSPTAQFRFEKGWSAELNGMYRTDITTGQFISGGYGRLNAGLQKKVSPAVTIKTSVNDIFRTQINKGIINNLALTDANYYNRYDTRQFVLSLSWRFGKTIADQRKHNASGADAERNRVR